MAISAQKATEIFDNHPTRFTKKEKAALRDTLRTELNRMGYADGEISEIKASGVNLAVGDPRTAEYVFTAHYDTPGRTGWMLSSSKLVGQTGANIVLMLVMIGIACAGPWLLSWAAEQWGIAGSDSAFWGFEGGMLAMLAVMILSMVIKNKNNRNDNTSGVLSLLSLAEQVAADEQLRGKCCFVFFDNEEWGLLGSSGFASWGKKQGIDWKKTKLINFDCVGNGDILTFASTKKNDAAESVTAAFREAGLHPVYKRSMLIFLSDHANFPNSVMVSYTMRSAIGLLYLPLIHTGKDTVCSIDQINGLTGRFYEMIRQGKI